MNGYADETWMRHFPGAGCEDLDTEADPLTASPLVEGRLRDHVIPAAQLALGFPEAKVNAGVEHAITVAYLLNMIRAAAGMWNLPNATSCAEIRAGTMVRDRLITPESVPTAVVVPPFA